MPIRTTLKRLVHEHDSIPAFHAGYLVVTFIVAALLNVGVFAVLILAHMALDTVKYRHARGFAWPHVFVYVVLESAFDLLLLSIAAVAAVYLHTQAGLVAVSGVVRSAETIIRGALTALPKLDVLHRQFDVFTNASLHMREPYIRLECMWKRTARMHFLGIALCIVLMALAPSILDLTMVQIRQILLEEFVPWNV